MKRYDLLVRNAMVSIVALAALAVSVSQQRAAIVSANRQVTDMVNVITLANPGEKVTTTYSIYRDSKTPVLSRSKFVTKPLEAVCQDLKRAKASRAIVRLQSADGTERRYAFELAPHVSSVWLEVPPSFTPFSVSEITRADEDILRFWDLPDPRPASERDKTTERNGFIIARDSANGKLMGYINRESKLAGGILFSGEYFPSIGSLDSKIQTIAEGAGVQGDTRQSVARELRVATTSLNVTLPILNVQVPARLAIFVISCALFCSLIALSRGLHGLTTVSVAEQEELLLLMAAPSVSKNELQTWLNLASKRGATLLAGCVILVPSTILGTIYWSWGKGPFVSFLHLMAVLCILPAVAAMKSLVELSLGHPLRVLASVRLYVVFLIATLLLTPLSHELFSVILGYTRAVDYGYTVRWSVSLLKKLLEVGLWCGLAIWLALVPYRKRMPSALVVRILVMICIFCEALILFPVIIGVAPLHIGFVSGLIALIAWARWELLRVAGRHDFRHVARSSVRSSLFLALTYGLTVMFSLTTMNGAALYTWPSPWATIALFSAAVIDYVALRNVLRRASNRGHVAMSIQ
jgi:hypothetical protein